VSQALDVLGGLVLENDSRWGEAAQSWQWSDARAVLEPGPDDPRSHFLTRPRGASKTTDLAGVATAALLTQLAPAARAYAVASDADQARLLVDAMTGFALRTPGIGGALQVDRWRVTATRTGASLEVLPADGPSAWDSCQSSPSWTRWPSGSRPPGRRWFGMPWRRRCPRSLGPGWSA
jgi:hypothetical protein